MSDRSPDTQDTPPEATQNGDIDSFRRKLTGSALGVSAIFTLASRPVLAGQCMTPSSAASGNLSHNGTVPLCTGNTPAQWLVLVAVSDARNVSFHTPPPPSRNGVFKSGTRADWGNNTVRQVMQNTGTGNTGSTPNPISKEFAAALLNIRGGLVPANVLTETQLIGMWNEWMDTGIFTPKAGATWDTNTIVWYLQSLQN